MPARIDSANDIFLRANGDFALRSEVAEMEAEHAADWHRSAKLIREGSKAHAKIMAAEQDAKGHAECMKGEPAQPQAQAEEPKRRAKHTEWTRRLMETCPAFCTGADLSAMIGTGYDLVSTLVAALPEGKDFEFSRNGAAEGMARNLYFAAESAITFWGKEVGRYEELATKGRALEMDGEGNRYDPRDSDRDGIWGLERAADRLELKIEREAEVAHRKALMAWGAVMACEEITGRTFTANRQDRSDEAAERAREKLRLRVQRFRAMRGAA